MYNLVVTCISIYNNPTLNLAKYTNDIRTSPSICQLGPVKHRIKVDWIVLPTFQNGTGVFVEASYQCHMSGP